MSLSESLSQPKEDTDEQNKTEDTQVSKECLKVSLPSIIVNPPSANPKEYYYKYYLFYPENGRCVEFKPNHPFKHGTPLVNLRGDVPGGYVYAAADVPVPLSFKCPPGTPASDIVGDILQDSHPELSVQSHRPGHADPDDQHASNDEDDGAKIGSSDRNGAATLKSTTSSTEMEKTPEGISTIPPEGRAKESLLFLDSGEVDVKVVVQCQWKKCYLQFESTEALVDHVNAKHLPGNSKKKVTCKWQGCPRYRERFKSVYLLRLHMRQHTGEQPHKCPYTSCDKKFSRQPSLRAHMNVHEDWRPYTCRYCTLSFHTCSDRCKHEKRKHPSKDATNCSRDSSHTPTTLSACSSGTSSDHPLKNCNLTEPAELNVSSEEGTLSCDDHTLEDDIMLCRETVVKSPLSPEHTTSPYACTLQRSSSSAIGVDPSLSDHSPPSSEGELIIDESGSVSPVHENKIERPRISQSVLTKKSPSSKKKKAPKRKSGRKQKHKSSSRKRRRSARLIAKQNRTPPLSDTPCDSSSEKAEDNSNDTSDEGCELEETGLYRPTPNNFAQSDSDTGYGVYKRAAYRRVYQAPRTQANVDEDVGRDRQHSGHANDSNLSDINDKSDDNNDKSDDNNDKSDDDIDKNDDNDKNDEDNDKSDDNDKNDNNNDKSDDDDKKENIVLEKSESSHENEVDEVHTSSCKTANNCSSSVSGLEADYQGKTCLDIPFRHNPLKGKQKATKPGHDERDLFITPPKVGNTPTNPHQHAATPYHHQQQQQQPQRREIMPTPPLSPPTHKMCFSSTEDPKAHSTIDSHYGLQHVQTVTCDEPNRPSNSVSSDHISAVQQWDGRESPFSQIMRMSRHDLHRSRSSHSEHATSLVAQQQQLSRTQRLSDIRQMTDQVQTMGCSGTIQPKQVPQARSKSHPVPLHVQPQQTAPKVHNGNSQILPVHRFSHQSSWTQLTHTPHIKPPYTVHMVNRIHCRTDSECIPLPKRVKVTGTWWPPTQEQIDQMGKTDPSSNANGASSCPGVDVPIEYQLKTASEPHQFIPPLPPPQQFTPPPPPPMYYAPPHPTYIYRSASYRHVPRPTILPHRPLSMMASMSNMPVGNYARCPMPPNQPYLGEFMYPPLGPHLLNPSTTPVMPSQQPPYLGWVAQGPGSFVPTSMSSVQCTMGTTPTTMAATPTTMAATPTGITKIAEPISCSTGQ